MIQKESFILIVFGIASVIAFLLTAVTNKEVLYIAVPVWCIIAFGVFVICCLTEHWSGDTA